MYLELDKGYHISFKAPYEAHLGVYYITHKVTYDELIKSKVDMVAHFFGPKLELTAKDWDDFAQGEFNGVKAIDDEYYRLEKPSDNLERDIIWAPASTFDGYPNAEIGCYKKLSLMLDLGIWADSEALSSVIETIEQHLVGTHGIESKVLVTEYDKIWMTTEGFKTDVTDVRATKATGATNYFALYNEQIKLTNKYKTKMEAMETKLGI